MKGERIIEKVKEKKSINPQGRYRAAGVAKSFQTDPTFSFCVEYFNIFRHISQCNLC